MGADLRAAATAGRLLVASDYDGTLAPLVDDPAAAYPDLDAVAALRDLAGLPNTDVAVISGRARADLQALLGPIPGARLIGGHGAEWTDGKASTQAAALTARLEDVAARYPGALVEPKPTGAAFHYRKVNAGVAEEAATTAIDTAAQLATRVVHGKRVVEFSTINADKGSALRRLREELSPDLTIFIGDDVTDEDAFSVLDRTDIGIKVGQGDTKAPWRLPGQSDVSSLLHELSILRSAIGF